MDGPQSNIPHNPADILSRIDKIKEAIWHRRPILGDIMRKHGGKILYQYAQDFMDVNKAPTLDPAKGELFDAATELIGGRLGKDVADKAARQLHKLALVSTADHHSPIDHPFWVNANIISAIPYFDHPDPDIFSLIVFSFASVSLNNASGYPRGILFHGGVGNASTMIRLPILPDKLKMGIVHGTRSFTRQDLDKTIHALYQKKKEGEVAPERADQLHEAIETYFAAPEVLGAAHLSSQITRLNYALWPKLFHAAKHATAPARPIPNLIYFEIETLVSKLLRGRHSTESTLLHRLIFRPDHWALALKHFNNVPGGFSLENNWGTFLFWAVDEKNHRVRLELEGEQLVSRTRPEIHFPLHPETIRTALETKKIFPSMLLCYIVISLYYGMKCLGGFCQVHDLTVLKERWIAFLRELGENKEADAVHPIQTKELGGDGMVLAYMKTHDGELFPASGLDMLLDERDTSYGKYVERSKKVTLMEMMNPMLPEMYTVLHPFPERDPAFASLTPEGIMEATGLAEKLRKEIEKEG